MADFDKAIRVVLEHEGRFVNNPNDPGGATDYGISLYWLKSLGDLDGDGELEGDVNHDGRVDIEDIKALTHESACGFYRTYWWEQYHFDHLDNDDVAAKVFDTAVNMGGVTAIRLLQQSLCAIGCPVAVDGKLGPATLAAANNASPDDLLEDFRRLQAGRYAVLAEHNPKLRGFLKGWLKRAAS